MDRVCICFLHSYTRWSALACGDDNDFLGRRPTNSDGEYDFILHDNKYKEKLW